MKNKFKITSLLLVFSFITVSSQELPLSQLRANNMENNTFVDIDNDLEPYVGTWLCQEGTTFFKIIK
jgi:hypothetical protein